MEMSPIAGRAACLVLGVVIGVFCSSVATSWFWASSVKRGNNVIWNRQRWSVTKVGDEEV